MSGAFEFCQVFALLALITGQGSTALPLDLLGLYFCANRRALGVQAEEYCVQVPLLKERQQNELPANYNLEDCLEACVKGAGLGSDPSGFCSELRRRNLIS